MAKVVIEKAQLSILVIVFSILFPTYSLFYSELHTSVAQIQYYSKITKFMKAIQLKTKYLINFFFIFFKKM
jgi:hypothetical protein